MASKAGGLLGPITGDTPESFVEKILTSPLGQQLRKLDEFAQKLRKQSSEQGDAIIPDNLDTSDEC